MFSQVSLLTQYISSVNKILIAIYDKNYRLPFNLKSIIKHPDIELACLETYLKFKIISDPTHLNKFTLFDLTSIQDWEIIFLRKMAKRNLENIVSQAKWYMSMTTKAEEVGSKVRGHPQ